MAAKQQSMADELLFNVSHIKYASYCSYISESDAVEVDEFPTSELYRRHWLDTSNCIREYKRLKKPVKRLINKSAILDTFAQYSTYSTDELRKMIKKEVEKNWAWYEELFSISLRMRTTPMKKWLHNQSLKSVQGDEMTIFVLSVIFRRHTIVYTKTRPWTTYDVQSNMNMSIEELHNQCETHLMYLGGGIFGTIHPRPYSIPTYRHVNLLITQQLTNVIRTIGKSPQSGPLDLSVPRCRDIEKIPDFVQCIEASDKTLAQISEQNKELYERRKYPLIDITDQETDIVTSENPIHASTVTDNSENYRDLEYLMDTSEAEPILPSMDTPVSDDLPDVTSETVLDPVMNPLIETVTSDIPKCTSPTPIEPVPVTDTAIPHGDHHEQFDWTPDNLHRSETKNCIVKICKLNKLDLALWCHPTRNDYTSKSKATAQTNMNMDAVPTDLNPHLVDTVTSDNELPAVDTVLSEHNKNNTVQITDMSATTEKTLQRNSKITPPVDSLTVSTPENTTQNNINTDPVSEHTPKTMPVTAEINPPPTNSGHSSSEEFPDVNEKLKYVANSEQATNDTIETILSNYSSPYRRRLRKAPLPRRLRVNGRNRRNIGNVNYADKNRLDSDSASETQKTRKELSSRPGPTPSKDRLSARTSNIPKQSQTYNVVPIKITEHTGDTTEIDSDTCETTLTGLDINSIARDTLDHNNNKSLLPPVTSENDTSGETDPQNEDDTPLAVLQIQLRKAAKPSKTVTSENSAKPTRGSFNCKTVGIPNHRKADKICPVCKIAKTSDDSLRDHITRRHSDLRCTTCSKQFITKATLRKHKYTHMTASWKCVDCPKSFFFQSELTTHRIRHESGKKLKCIYKNCEHEFSYSWDYNAHLDEHKNPPRKCPEPGCDFDTKSKRDMKQHSRTHTDELPYKCKQCGKGFRFTQQRKRHVNTDDCPANPRK